MMLKPSLEKWMAAQSRGPRRKRLPVRATFCAG